jgi:hypothetical protein
MVKLILNKGGQKEMFLIRLWDKYDNELFIDLHRRASPPRPVLKQKSISLFSEILKTLLIGSGILRKKEKKR